MPVMEPLIRTMRAEDLEVARAIYNHAVLTSLSTFDIEPRSPQQQQDWFAQRSARHPALVAELDERVVAWASLGTFIPRPAADRTAEVAIYVDSDCHGRGIGGRLLEALVAAGRAGGLHLLVSRITTTNHASLRIHERCGFQHGGMLPQAGHKFDRWMDLILLYRLLGDEAPSASPGKAP